MNSFKSLLLKLKLKLLHKNKTMNKKETLIIIVVVVGGMPVFGTCVPTTIMTHLPHLTLALFPLSFAVCFFFKTAGCVVVVV